MKIGYYVNHWPTISGGGVSTYLTQLHSALSEIGHEIYFITHNPTSNFSSENIIDIKKFKTQLSLPQRIYRRFSSRFWFDWEGENIAKAFSWAVDHFNLDIIEIEDTYGWGFDVTKAVSIPVIIHLHGPWQIMRPLKNIVKPSKEDKARIKREDNAYRHAKAISSPSNYALASIKKINLPNRLCKTIYHGIEIPKKQWSFNPKHQFKILFVGRFDNVKGADLALEAFSILASKNKNCELHMAGRDLGINDGFQNYHYEEFIKLRGLQKYADRIHYHKDLNQEAIHTLRLNSGITIVPSRAETFCFALLEAMSFGCPVVAHDICNIPELIEQNKTGFLIQPDDPQALASKIQFLFDNPIEAERIGKNARHIAAEQYNVTRFANDTLKFYKEVIDYYKGS